MSLRMTLREIVQSTLSSMDSDAVETIGETIESQQIAIVAKETFYEIATYQDIPQHIKMTQLDGLQDLTAPTVMRIPTGCVDIANIKYRHTKNGRVKMEDIDYLHPDDFYNKMWCLDTTADNVGINEFTGDVTLPYRNDQDPCYWTTFDDEHIIFDSYNKEISDTLFNDASFIRARIIEEFQLEDDYIPDLPAKMFPQYLQQVKELSFFEKKQMANPLEGQKRKRSEHRNRHLVGINDGLDDGIRRRNLGRPRNR